jgi:hypothetical protein
MTTNEQAREAMRIVLVVADIIREAGEIPSGHLYAALAERGMTLNNYNAILDTLKRTGLVQEANHLLTWDGPDVAEAQRAEAAQILVDFLNRPKATE